MGIWIEFRIDRSIRIAGDATWMLRRKNQLTQKLENFVSSSIRSLTFLCSPSFEAKSLRDERRRVCYFFGKVGKGKRGRGVIILINPTIVT